MLEWDGRGGSNHVDVGGEGGLNNDGNGRGGEDQN